MDDVTGDRLATVLEGTPYTAETRPASRHDRVRYTLRREGAAVGEGTLFTGTRYVDPWLELQPAAVFDPDDEDHRALFRALADALAPGGHLMVHYLDDETTAEALTADVPPAATPVGFLLWEAGARWYKDWYFTEGWMEGDQKLQGNLPVDEAHRREREEETRAALEAFLAEDGSWPRCRELARRVLDGL